MSAGELLRSKIGLPPVSQIGIVVKNVNRSADMYMRIFGLPEFYIYDLEVKEHWYYGERAPVKMRMGKSQWGQVEIELIQHLEGEKSLFPGWIETHGEGLNHLGFEVDDYEAVHRKMVAEGFDPIQWIETEYSGYKNGIAKACYFDTRRIAGVIFEIMWRSWTKENAKK
jgi:catechol 2,3-dioxygenase-like lactoylglutathione lyase family enzyme